MCHPLRYCTLLYGVLLVSLAPVAAQWQPVTGPIDFTTLLTVLDDRLWVSDGPRLYRQTVPDGPLGPGVQVSEDDTFIESLTAANGVLYAGTYGDGVFRSFDDGATWAPFSAGLGAFTRYITALAQRGDSLYAATEDGLMVLNLETPTVWAAVSDVFERNEASTLLDVLAVGDWLYVSGGANGLVFRNRRGTEAWTVHPVTPFAVGVQVGALAQVGETLLAADARRVYRSHDRAETWEMVPFGRTGTPSPFATDAQHVWIGRAGLGFGDLYHSSDAGASWEVVYSGFEVFTVAVTPQRLYVARTDGLWAQSRSPVFMEPPPPPFSWAVYPNPAHGTLYVVHGAGARVVVEVVDGRGRRVARWEAAPHQPLAVDTSAWPAGLYIVRATANGNTHTRQVVLF